MSALHKNRVQMTVTSVASAGVGTITLNAASSGYQTFASAYAADATVDILITEGTTWEVARDCAYTNSGTTVGRGTLEASSTGSAVAFISAALVSVVLTAEKGNQLEGLSEVFGKTEISVTGAVTATIGRMHHCTGTTADYTVTLPAASGNAGKLIGFRMGSASGLTKLITIDGNASEAIDGATTRIMWAKETAILLCDGSNWHKVAGKSIPMFCLMHRNGSDQTGVVTATMTKVTLDTITADSAGMGDTGNARINIKRAGLYVVSGAVGWNTLSAASARILTQIQVKSVGFVNSEGSNHAAAAFTCPFAVKPNASLAVADTITVHGYQATGSNQTMYGTSSVSHVSALEVPTW